MSPDLLKARTDYWASFGLRDARMMNQSNLALLTPQDVAREVVRAVTQPRNVWIDTIELQPTSPQKKKGTPR
jgi:NADP-dependent 3-hydroxy acid dehydrogenase YdfG